MLCVTAALVILQCEFQEEEELDESALSTMMHQLSNLTGPKLTMIRRALDVADELWASTPLACLTVSETDLTQNEVKETTQEFDRTTVYSGEHGIGNKVRFLSDQYLSGDLFEDV